MRCLKSIVSVMSFLGCLGFAVVSAAAEGGSINVTAGTYGANCGQGHGNMTGHLASSCNGKAECSYTIDYHVIGDPADGCAKDYVAEWTCGDGVPRSVKVDAEAGRGSAIYLQCTGTGITTPPDEHILQAEVVCDPDPLTINVGELPSKSCIVWISGWNHDTASPVQLVLPDAVDAFGNHENGIQINFGTMSSGSIAGVAPSNMGGFKGPDGSYGVYYPWGIFVFACPAQQGTGANCVPGFDTADGPFSVPMIVRQSGSRDAMVTLSGMAFGAPVATMPGAVVHIQNRWKPTEFLHIEHGALESGPILPEWWSAQWEVEPVAGTNFVRFRNHWQRDQYLNIEQGLASSPAPEHWWSAMWEVIPVPNTPGFAYIRNRWVPDVYLHIENGRIECGYVNAEWWSAMWAIQ